MNLKESAPLMKSRPKKTKKIVQKVKHPYLSEKEVRQLLIA